MGATGPRSHARLQMLHQHTMQDEPRPAHLPVRIVAQMVNSKSLEPPKPQLLPRCSGPGDLTASAYLPTLEPDDIDFFKKHGFLIKKQLLDPVKTELAMSRVWDVLERKALRTVPGITGERYQHSISPGIRRDDPDTWVGASANFDGKHPGGLRSLGHLNWMRELIPYDPNVRAIARRMLGPLRETRRVRGVYPVFPRNEDHLKHGAAREEDESGLAELGPHLDGQVNQLNAMCYLSDVGPRCGGTTVWPGSHKRFYPIFEFESNGRPTRDNLSDPQYCAVLSDVLANVRPLEVTGEAGDVLWWHGRMLHCVGIHRSDSIRFVIPADFQQDRPTVVAASLPFPAGFARGGHRGWPDDTPQKAVEKYAMEWQQDSMSYKNDCPPQNDMWASWTI